MQRSRDTVQRLATWKILSRMARTDAHFMIAKDSVVLGPKKANMIGKRTRPLIKLTSAIAKYLYHHINTVVSKTAIRVAKVIKRVTCARLTSSVLLHTFNNRIAGVESEWTCFKLPPNTEFCNSPMHLQQRNPSI